MKLFILIKADYNDGDYTWRKSPITVEQIEEIKPMIKALEERDGDYGTRDCASSEENAYEVYKEIPGFDLFDEFVPYAEYGIHTIESIEIIQVIDKLY